MNLLEQYIEEVHSVRIYDALWTRKFPNTNFVEVEVTTNCYGNVTRKKHVFQAEEWEKFKKQGYWMA